MKIITQLVGQLTLPFLSIARFWAAILPNRCVLCHQSVDWPDTGVCKYCLPQCLYQTPICLGCGKTMQLLQCYCGQCLTSTPLKVIAPCSYHQPLGPWIGSIKYNAQFAVLPPLALALANRIRQLHHAGLIRLPQVLVPVPLHPKRVKQRGFNQALLIAQALSRILGLPIDESHLQRHRHTPPQAGLNGKQRRKNLQAAFSLSTTFPYQRFALIDDVVTTATTATEISRLFTQQDVDVQVWCLARAEAPFLQH